MAFNMKKRCVKLTLKSLFCFSVLILLVATAMAVSFGPNTAKKFEGVWKAPDGSLICMGPVDAVSQTGPYVVQTLRGQKFEHVYEILAMDEVTNTIRIQIEFADTRMPPVQQELTLQKDPTRCSRRIISANKPVGLSLFRTKKDASDTLTYVSRNNL